VKFDCCALVIPALEKIAAFVFAETARWVAVQPVTQIVVAMLSCVTAELSIEPVIAIAFTGAAKTIDVATNDDVTSAVMASPSHRCLFVRGNIAGEACEIIC
jgi:hypothetical protein